MLEEASMETRSQDIKFVIGSEGKPIAVLIDISTWEYILDALEDAEDVALVKEAFAALDAAGGDLEKAGFISWVNAKAELERVDDAEK
jgi:PHD/YefM family antitoxin component YafN of YafNO toxin-antitoxin module